MRPEARIARPTHRRAVHAGTTGRAGGSHGSSRQRLPTEVAIREVSITQNMRLFERFTPTAAVAI